MNDPIAIPDERLIPYCAEGILARRWLAKNVKEGKILPQLDASNPNERPKDAIAANMERGKETRQRILNAIQEGCNTVPDIKEKLGMGESTVRNHIQAMGQAGIIEKVGAVTMNASRAFVWRVKP